MKQAAQTPVTHINLFNTHDTHTHPPRTLTQVDLHTKHTQASDTHTRTHPLHTYIPSNSHTRALPP